MLWVGVHLPALSLEAFQALLGEQSTGQPVALLEQHLVVGADAVAREAGVQPGMKRATALALAPSLLMGSADAQRDALALRTVAHELLAFTPAVTMVPPQGVLAEVQASLRCFGGPQRLWQRMRDALAPLGHRVQMAHAPSAQAAWLLACRQDTPQAPGGASHWETTHRQLAALPVELLVKEPAALAHLRAMGLQSLADLRRQPRAGLARRFGAALLDALDRAWGEAPDPRAWVELPLRFESQVDLWARADNTEALLGGAEVLLARLLAWARARHARVLSFELELQHETRLRAGTHGEAGPHVSSLAIALAEPTGDARHLQAVLRERLARNPLEAPVLAMRLRCEHPVLGPPPDGELFPSAAGQREGLLRLLERLQARLGPAGVQRLAEHADHRPELATALHPATECLPPTPPPAGARSPTLTAPVTTPHTPPPRLTRPFWLLKAPRALPERHHLRLLAGPERIEAGWWDGALASRDYFIAQAPAGELLWIYRLRPAPSAGQPAWFLHGRFG